MPKSYVTRSVKITPELDEQVTATMKQIGSRSFTDFVLRALAAEVRLAELRDQNLQQIAAEDPAAYNSPSLKVNSPHKKVS